MAATPQRRDGVRRARAFALCRSCAEYPTCGQRQWIASMPTVSMWSEDDQDVVTWEAGVTQCDRYRQAEWPGDGGA